MSFFTIIQHLLPRSRAWSLVVDRTLRKFFQGLADGAPESARTQIDSVWAQIDPDTTDEIAEYETMFGIVPNVADTEAVRRTRLGARWATRGGQGPDYIEGRLQAAGFDLYAHPWWTQGTGTTLVDNGGFEEGDPPTGWAEYNGGNPSQVEALAGCHGSYALKIENGIGAPVGGVQYNGALEVGKTYRVQAKCAGDGTNGYAGIYGGVVAFSGTTSADVQEIDVTFTATLTTLYLFCYGDALTDDACYFDDLRLTETWEKRDPRSYVDDVYIGTTQCSAFASQPQCRPSEWDDGTPAIQWVCNAWLVNNPRYLVNVDLTRRAPPPVPDDEDKWPHFIYIGPETLDTTTTVAIPASRRVDLETMLLQLCPTEKWIVLMTDFINEGVFDASFSEDFE